MEKKIVYVPTRISDSLPTENGFYFCFDPNAHGALFHKENVFRFNKHNQTWYDGSDTYHPDVWLRPVPVSGIPSEEEMPELAKDLKNRYPVSLSPAPRQSDEEIVTDEEINSVWENANFGTTPRREVIRKSLYQITGGYSTGKTARSILSELGLVHLVNDHLAPTDKGIEYLLSLARQQGEAQNKVEIPKCLEECRLTDDDVRNGILKETDDAYRGSIPSYFEVVKWANNKLLEKFALLLREAGKGLKTMNDYNNWWDSRSEVSPTDVFDYFNNSASLSLAAKDEQHKEEEKRITLAFEEEYQALQAELLAKDKQGKEFAEWATSNFRRSYPVGVDHVVWHPDGYKPQFEKRPYTTDELFDLFLRDAKEKGDHQQLPGKPQPTIELLTKIIKDARNAGETDHEIATLIARYLESL